MSSTKLLLYGADRQIQYNNDQCSLYWASEFYMQ